MRAATTTTATGTKIFQRAPGDEPALDDPVLDVPVLDDPAADVCPADVCEGIAVCCLLDAIGLAPAVPAAPFPAAPGTESSTAAGIPDRLDSVSRCRRFRSP